MKKERPNRKQQHQQQQSGIVLIMLAMLLPVYIMMLTLLFDLGKLYIVSKQAQNLADTGASAGAFLLLKSVPAIYDSVEAQNYGQIKPMLRSLAEITPIFGAAKVPDTTTFNFGDATYAPPEQIGYKHDSFKITQPGIASLTMEVRRGLRCFDSDGTRNEIDLDIAANKDHWCLANYVTTKVVISDSEPYFARFLGFTTLTDINRVAIAHVRPIPEACNTPLCASYSAYLSKSGSAWYVDVNKPHPLCTY